MKRPWTVLPDPETGFVNRDEMIQAFLEAENILARAGGVLSVVTHRAETGTIPGEMGTVAAVFEWKDRTDAKPQPERAVRPAEALVDPTPDELETALEAEIEHAEARAEAPEGNPDGLVLDEVEDLSAIPAEQR